MATATLQQTAMTPENFRRRLETARQRVENWITTRGNERLREAWPEWQQRFDALVGHSHDRHEVAISLVGGVGAGKSTLLNALIGARVLPVSNMRACTAAVSEVSFTEGAYRARVEFVSRESWQQQIDVLLNDLRDARMDDSAEGDSTARSAISRDSWDKLWTVYRPDENANKDNFDPFQLVEPPEITEALDRGLAEIECADLREFRKQLKVYLDSHFRFWPLVKTVSIQGPFEALADGAKLIDLPGVNDPNEAREAVTRRHLKTCRFVWIVFNIKRILTRDTINLLESDDFLRQIVMDGRADALTFVGTAADDLDPDSAIEELDLDEDAELPEIVAARNDAARRAVREQLDDLSRRLAHMAHESPEAADRLSEMMQSSRIITISAKEYLRLAGLSRDRSVTLDTVEQTELPALREHMQRICSRYGVEAHVASLNRQLDVLLAEIRREIQQQRSVLEHQAEVTERQREEMRAAVNAAHQFLDRDLGDARERLAQDLESLQALLAERVKRAVDRARHDLEDLTFNRWANLHANTLKAVCRRGGVYWGKARHDLPADLCKPILNGIAFAWSEFFGEKLRQTLERWAERLHRHADDHRRRLLDNIAAAGDLPAGIAESLADIFQTTEDVVNEILKQTSGKMDARITEKQRTLYESVPDQVRANMQPAFERAAEEKGLGMRERIVNILSEHAHRVSRQMFDDAQESLLQGVRSLNNWLETEYANMTAAVRRNAELAADHLVSNRGQVTAERIERELAQLEQFREQLETLMEAADDV